MAQTIKTRPTLVGKDESRPATPTRAIGPVTTHKPFFPSTGGGSGLFAVQAGIPLGDAFDQLGLLLGATEELAVEVATTAGNGNDVHSAWATVHLLTFTRALASSMHSGLMRSQKSRLEADEGV